MKKNVLGLAILLVAFVLPMVYRGPYVMDVGIQILFSITLALGLNVVVGYAGLLDLGYAAYFAVGAYGAGILTQRLHLSFWLALVVAGVAAMLLGLLIGGTVLRLRSDYLAIVTLGFGEIIRIVATNLDVTGGPTGIFSIPAPNLFGFTLNQPMHYYYLTLVLVILSAVALSRVADSRIGRAWACIREDQDAAECMGIPTLRFRLLAYAAGTCWAGLTGAIFAVKMTAVSPLSFGFMQSITILLAVVMGGLGSIPGVILGGAIVILLPEALRSVAEWRYLVFGVVLILLMIFRPSGLWPARSAKEEK
ncbi:MAG TPA: branched-chain amino acid ABC transporter permease [Symbiobacteriaceae bacterium]|nr:branched-chain amino acid ABC transporter permease [Symbiobacteriaceae bacterium]